MSESLVRLSIVLVLCLLSTLVVWLGRRFVERRRQQVLNRKPAATMANEASTAVRILSFSSADCRQCHQLQTPALRRVQDARGDAVRVVDIDAPTSPALTQQYNVLTIPTTVVLDAGGQAHAVNYGFTNAPQLLEQIDAVLAQSKK